MKDQVFRAIVFLLLWCLSCPCFAATSSEKIGLVIVAITERWPKGVYENDGALEVRFENKSEHAVTLPFSGLYGKGVGLITPIYAAPSAQYPQPASFSIFRYEWFDEKGNLAFAGTYESSHKSLILKSKRSGRIWIPIKLPKMGRYQFVLKFSNKEIAPVEGSYNMFRSTEPSVYVDLQEQANVTIGK